MAIKKIFRQVDLFSGLTDDEIQIISSITQDRILNKGEILIDEGDAECDLFIIEKGNVEVTLSRAPTSDKIVLNLGVGQILGEMALVDSGLRSATVRASQDSTKVVEFKSEDFHKLCRNNNRIGYVVMFNMAADLSFKLRHHHKSV